METVDLSPTELRTLGNQLDDAYAHIRATVNDKAAGVDSRRFEKALNEVLQALRSASSPVGQTPN